MQFVQMGSFGMKKVPIFRGGLSRTSSPKGNDRSPESNVPRSNLISKNSNSSKLNACSCYMKVSKGSNQKQQRKSGNTIFPIIRSIGVFLRRSRAANSVVGGPIWPKFELIHNIMQQV